MRSDLLPCPFCGSREIGIVHCEKDCCGAEPRLVECGCGVDMCGDWSCDKDAIDSWNTRVVDGHVVTFFWERPGQIGPTETWVVCEEGYMYGPCKTWQEVETIIREEWMQDRNLVG